MVTFLPTRLPFVGGAFFGFGRLSAAFFAFFSAALIAAAERPRFFARTAPRLSLDFAATAFTFAVALVAFDGVAAFFLGAFLGAFFFGCFFAAAAFFFSLASLEPCVRDTGGPERDAVRR